MSDKERDTNGDSLHDKRHIEGMEKGTITNGNMTDTEKYRQVSGRTIAKLFATVKRLISGN